MKNYKEAFTFTSWSIFKTFRTKSLSSLWVGTGNPNRYFWHETTLLVTCHQQKESHSIKTIEILCHHKSYFIALHCIIIYWAFPSYISRLEPFIVHHNMRKFNKLKQIVFIHLRFTLYCLNFGHQYRTEDEL